MLFLDGNSTREEVVAFFCKRFSCYCSCERVEYRGVGGVGGRGEGVGGMLTFFQITWLRRGKLCLIRNDYSKWCLCCCVLSLTWWETVVDVHFSSGPVLILFLFMSTEAFQWLHRPRLRDHKGHRTSGNHRQAEHWADIITDACARADQSVYRAGGKLRYITERPQQSSRTTCETSEGLERGELCFSTKYLATYIYIIMIVVIGTPIVLIIVFKWWCESVLLNTESVDRCWTQCWPLATSCLLTVGDGSFVKLRCKPYWPAQQKSKIGMFCDREVEVESCLLAPPSPSLPFPRLTL